MMKTTSEKWFLLDGLRIALALIIFFFHALIHLGCHYGFLTPFFRQGAVVMTTFFMLSGFVLQGKCLKVKNPSDITICIDTLQRFYHRRLWSIYPLYLVVFLLALIFYNTLPWSETILLLPAELLLAQSFFDTLFPVLLNGGTWFLSCLLFCMFLSPFVDFLLAHCRRLRLFGLGLFALISYAPFVVYVCRLSSIYANPVFRALEFSFGMLLAHVYKARPAKRLPQSRVGILSLTLIGFVAVILLTEQWPVFYNQYVTYAFLIVPCSSICIYVLASCQTGVLPRLMQSKQIQYCNALSLSFFLAQSFTFPLIQMAQPLPILQTHRNIKLLAAAFLLNAGLSVLLHEGVEKRLTPWLQGKFATKTPN